MWVKVISFFSYVSQASIINSILNYFKNKLVAGHGMQQDCDENDLTEEDGKDECT